MARKKWLIPGLIAFLSLILLGYLAGNLTSRPGFCAGCHEMKSASASWELSAHNRGACTSCHRLTLLNKGAMLLGHLSGKPGIVHVKDTSCLNCHSRGRIVTPRGDLIIPHLEHLDNNIACARCHAGTAHSDAKEAGELGGAQTIMALCLGCHFKRSAPLGCKQCHLKPPITFNHLNPGWEFRHGQEAQKNPAACNSCHKYTLFLASKGNDNLEDTLASAALYARRNQFCATCHRSRPVTHNYYFLHDHAYSAYGREDDCLVCHNWDYALPTELASWLYCGKCHPYRGWVPVLWGREQPQRRQP